MDLLSGPPTPPTTLVEEHGSWVEGGCSREPPDRDRRQPPPCGHSAAAVRRPVDGRRPDGRRQVRLLLGNRYDGLTAAVIQAEVPAEPHPHPPPTPSPPTSLTHGHRCKEALNGFITFKSLLQMTLLKVPRIASSRHAGPRRFYSPSGLLLECLPLSLCLSV